MRGDRADAQAGLDAHPDRAGVAAHALGRVRRDLLRVLTHPAVLAGYPHVDADDWVRWTERLGIVHGADADAFAIPGGYVYITRQLMALCNDEAEMAGVLGHEVGHVAAMHSKRRQSAATKTALGGALLQILTGAVLGNSGLGGMLQQGIGQGAQLLTLKFSRSQEYEADDLGIRYLAKGGYDPKALSTMLSSLAAQSALDARVAGQNKTIPEWASTHPDPASRVQRALGRAAETDYNQR